MYQDLHGLRYAAVHIYQFEEKYWQKSTHIVWQDLVYTATSTSTNNNNAQCLALEKVCYKYYQNKPVVPVENIDPL